MKIITEKFASMDVLRANLRWLQRTTHVIGGQIINETWEYHHSEKGRMQRPISLLRSHSLVKDCKANFNQNEETWKRISLEEREVEYTEKNSPLQFVTITTN